MSTPGIQPTLGLVDLITTDELKGNTKAIVLAALRARNRATPSLRRSFDSLLRRTPVDGFRDALHAQPNFVAAEIAKHVATHPTIIRPYIDVWLDTEIDRREQVRSFLTQTNEEGGESDASTLPRWPIDRSGCEDAWKTYNATPSANGTLPSGLEHIFFASVFLSLAKEWEGPGPDENFVGDGVSQTDDKAVTSTELDNTPSSSDDTTARNGDSVGEGVFNPEDADEAALTLTAPLWIRTLEDLRALSDDAPEWREAEAFRELVQMTVTARESRRQEWERLSLRLAGICSRYEELFALFDWSVGLHWRVTNPTITMPELNQRIDELDAKLAEYVRLDTTVPASAVERRMLRQRLASLELGLADLKDRVFSVVAIDESSPHPTQPPTSPSGPPTVSEPTHNGDYQEDVVHHRDEILDSTITSPFDSPILPAAEPQKVAEEGATPILDLPASSDMQSPTTSDYPNGGSEESAVAPDTLEAQGEEKPHSEASAMFQAEDNPMLETTLELGEWTDVFWETIERDDLAAAYWLARAREASDEPLAIPSWLVRAVEAARWVSDVDSAFLPDLAAISLEHSVSDNIPARLLAASAALGPSLLSASTGLIGWLEDLDRGIVIGLGDLVKVVRTFTERGLVLYPSDLHGALSQAQRDAEIADVQRQARQWIEDAPRIGTNYQRASSVMRTLSNQSELRSMIDIVLADRRAEIEQCKAIAERWRGREALQRAIEEHDREHHAIHASPIVGFAFERLSRHVADGRQIALRWASLVRGTGWSGERVAWRAAQIDTLLRDLRAALPAARETIATLRQIGDRAAPAALCLDRAIYQLCRLLAFQSDGFTPPISSESTQYPDLDTLLSARLLVFPEIDLQDNGEPWPEDLPRLAELIRSTGDRSLRPDEAIATWIERQDYRFIDDLLPLVSDVSLRNELAIRRDDHRAGSRAALRSHRDEVVETIERAFVDGIISEEDRSAFGGRLESVPSGDDVLNYRRCYSQLESIRRDLDSARVARIDRQKQEWSRLREILESRFPRGAGRNWIEVVEAAFMEGDTRIIDECFSHLASRVNQGDLGEASWFNPPSVRDALSEFIKALPLLEEVFSKAPRLTDLVEQLEGGPSAALVAALPSIATLSYPRRLEAKQAFQAWSALKGRKSIPQPDDVASVVQFLGYSISQTAPIRVEPSRRDNAFFTVNATSGGLSPIPQFGSSDDNKLNVVCVWERPGVETIGARLQELQLRDRNVLVLFLGRLTRAQRLELVGYSRREGLAMVVLDETLLLFLTGEKDARLPVFLACALPFASVNPFTPFIAGDVPPEMFKGRAEMRQSLQRDDQHCIVYGGRQIGKSALLRQVAREFNAPGREQYAVLCDIKLIGDPQSNMPADTIWQALRERLVEIKLLRANGSERPREIQKQILTALERGSSRLLVLFDEADNFLDTDQKQNFLNVHALKSLMEQTGRRFKVVFAGLHNVQRFHLIPNQPLAHLGQPLLVGPLDPEHAQELIRAPLHALGFRFDKPSLILRILSYTNYHPGLIQLFCRDLVGHLQKKRIKGLPPYVITTDDVEAVYLDADVRRGIRERFEWTLALDPRYQAIVWSMIEQQLQDPDDYARAYTAAEIRDRVCGWWAKGFEGCQNGAFRGILDELCGLGVLVVAEGRYRLRGPNLVRLLGTTDEIEDHLLQLTDQSLPAVLDEERHHPRIGQRLRNYSPLTYAQERSLNPSRFGVGLIFSSPSLGLGQLPDALVRFLPADSKGEIAGHVIELREPIESAEAMTTLLEQCLPTPGDAQRTIVLCWAKEPKDATAQQVSAAISFCRQRQSAQRHWMRVFFVFDPTATRRWLQLPSTRRRDLENRVDAVVWPSRWDLVGVRQLLDDHQMLATPEACGLVLEATGGWPALLGRLADGLKRIAGSNDPRDTARAFAEEPFDLARNPTHKYLTEFGLVDDDVKRVCVSLASLGTIPTSDLASYVNLALGSDGTLTELASATVEYLTRLGLISITDDWAKTDPIVVRLLRDA